MKEIINHLVKDRGQKEENLSKDPILRAKECIVILKAPEEIHRCLHNLKIEKCKSEDGNGLILLYKGSALAKGVVIQLRFLAHLLLFLEDITIQEKQKAMLISTIHMF